MNTIELVYKPLSLTPLQTIQRLQKLKPQYHDKKIGYAGRLDPMAEGLLLLLIGEENKKRKKYERLEKEYEFEVLLGVETDTYDCMGMVNKFKAQNSRSILEIRNLKLEISQLLNSYMGSWYQPYPPYSAARIDGKPLYYWAREGKIKQVTIPSKKITIGSIQLNKVTSVKLSEIYPEIISRIQSVDGEFRQTEILSCWKEVFTKNTTLNLVKLSCTVSCSSGTYVRSISHSIGRLWALEGPPYRSNGRKLDHTLLKMQCNFSFRL